MRGLKTLFASAALLAGMALTPAAQAQIVVGIGVGIQPVCQYGYYDYAPYACSPYGFYGPGYFYNGIFLGMGPWAGWGYGHGWGGHRFSEDGGGRYHGGIGRVAYGGHSGGGRPARIEGDARVNSGGARPSAGHSAPHNAAPRAASHSAGGSTHSGGEQAHGGAKAPHGNAGGHPGGDHK